MSIKCKCGMSESAWHGFCEESHQRLSEDNVNNQLRFYHKEMQEWHKQKRLKLENKKS